MEKEGKQRDELLNKLATGEIKSDDPHVNYALDRLREKGAQSIGVKGQYDQATRAVEQLRNKLIELDAECDSHEEDALNFYEMSLKKADPLSKGTE